MCTLLKNTIATAKKEYDCHASVWLMEGIFSYSGSSGMTFAELREVVKARKKKFKIYPGERYVYQFIVDGSDKWVFRAIPELHAICLKYDVYPEC